MICLMVHTVNTLYDDMTEGKNEWNTLGKLQKPFNREIYI